MLDTDTDINERPCVHLLAVIPFSARRSLDPGRNEGFDDEGSNGESERAGWSAKWGIDMNANAARLLDWAQQLPETEAGIIIV
jgi:hypothetical protein